MYKLLIFTFLSLGCSDSKYNFVTLDNDKDGKPDQTLHLHKGLNSAILIESDTDLDGKMDDYLWVEGSPSDKESSLLLFNLAKTKDNVTRRTWYGPASLKLIEKSDEDGDGYFETTAYFNKFAKPKVLQGIVARIEIDKTKNKQTDIWIYPGKRMEIDKDGDGLPDCLIAENEKIRSVYEKNPNWLEIQKEVCVALPQSKSFALHPEQIKEERLRAIILFGIGQ